MAKFRRMKDSRHGLIMEAALKVFAEQGLVGAGIADIARTANISTGTFYLYFQNKEDLVIQLLDESVRVLRRTQAKAIESEGPPLLRFEHAGRAFFREFCGDRREMLILFLRDSVGVSHLVEEKRKAVFQLMIDDITGAIIRITGGKGRVARRKAQVMAVSIFGMMERVAYHYYIWQMGSKDLRKVEDEALVFIRDGLGSVMPKGGRRAPA